MLLEERHTVGAVSRKLAELAIEYRRVTDELAACRRALRDARRLAVEHADEERRRIARDLHDGVQGSLVLAAVRADRLARAGGAGTDEAACLRRDLDRAIDGLRAVVHGVIPPVLYERGLYDAVDDLLDRLPLRTELRVVGPRPALPRAVAATAYFVVAESTTNVVKHARASAVRITISTDARRLRVEVGDDGIGGVSESGVGVRGMRDRASAFGGTLAVTGVAGCGTLVELELPCEW